MTRVDACGRPEVSPRAGRSSWSLERWRSSRTSLRGQAFQGRSDGVRPERFSRHGRFTSFALQRTLKSACPAAASEAQDPGTPARRRHQYPQEIQKRERARACILSAALLKELSAGGLAAFGAQLPVGAIKNHRPRLTGPDASDSVGKLHTVRLRTPGTELPAGLSEPSQNLRRSFNWNERLFLSARNVAALG
jgi:hypothetical protein